ncbi:E3 ubiquitin-protein ligase UBR2-like [Micropterus dolomieu]|uniref:E3 ubiquitin-protein ligase UBR2-like n=1 Tax=Micropterus dolomieu TaxID=147949 RepID=UPI001E8E361B|nr:E3 ubiquitin-protein ligase UBR2-like [Micropterus dolomieu]
MAAIRSDSCDADGLSESGVEECAADPTCVLCMQCFLGSVHKEHRYRMTTSGGGGFCDCGDAEAWKKGPYCQKHTPAANNRDAEEDPVAQLPADMVARGYSIFSIILKYAVDMLTWDQEDQLPAGLEPPERADTYYCMLFNDEVHTYEQVIYTLQKAVNCSQKEAVSFATTVDRDGRKSVRYGDFQFCEQAKSVIVRNTSRQSKPLRVEVMHSSVVAHQCFALRALSWLGQVIQYSDGLRRILCQVGLQRGPEGENSSLVDQLMLNDSKMWKGARNIYHQLLMNSLLMDLKYKKIFAIQFAKNYRRLQTDFMEDDHERVVSVTSLSVQLFTVPTMSYERLQCDYVRDDHDREFSITDLSVQIFTVPSLARMLMVEENLMTTIIRTFVDHLRHRDLQGRFQFDRYTAQQAFKFGRVQSLIGDLKYVLISHPSEWSDQLRQKFLEGLDAFLELLKCMQGMDPVVRQVGQHIEMEPEWEAAFTLQMKLTHIISMIQEWCSTDEHVLIEAYRKCLSALSHCHSGLPDGEQPLSLSLAGHCVETFRYQVSQDKVSIHLPVCRLLAGLHVLLSRTEVTSRFPEQLPLGELSPPLLIELPLRCLVLCAQVHAGMWRRNGFSLINQIYYYHNVKCRVEMFDKDIVMLQAGASMMDPNHFLMIVLSRFELFHIFSSADCRKRYREANKHTKGMRLIHCTITTRFTCMFYLCVTCGLYLCFTCVLPLCYLCRCPRSGGDKSRAPTLCLVCGSMLCSQSYCCQTEVDGEDVGACTAHTFTCGAGLGLFLRVRESQVLFVAGKTKGCFYPPPYLDDYGETDQGLKRGNPLHLCSERYRKIERLWRQHGVAEVIGHAQEANQTLVAIDWQHL